MASQYGRPVYLPSLDKEVAAHPLAAIPYEVKKSEGGYDEDWLENLIARHPEILPFDEIDPALASAACICTQMPLEGGNSVDLLLMTNQGDLVLVECKLWRNPEARRAVIGQILDYAAELATWSYEKLENAVKRAKSPPGVDKSAKLIDRVRRDGGLEEPKFIDAVYRNLRRGRFLLLIVGDGIREGIGSIAAFLEGHAGLHFDFALAELPVIPLPNGMGYIVQPRVVASTERILRGIVEFRDDRVEIRPPPALGSASRPGVAGTITEERFYELLEQIEHGLGARAQEFFEKIKEFGIEKEPSRGFTFRLKAQAAGKSWDLGSISGENGLFWIDHLMNNEKLANRWPDLIRYYRTLAENLEEPERARALNTVGTKSGTRTLRLAALLKHPDIWLDAMQAYLRTTENAEAK